MYPSVNRVVPCFCPPPPPLLFHKVVFGRKERVKGGPPKAPSSMVTTNKAVHTYINGKLQPQVRTPPPLPARALPIANESRNGNKKSKKGMKYPCSKTQREARLLKVALLRIGMLFCFAEECTAKDNTT